MANDQPVFNRQTKAKQTKPEGRVKEKQNFCKPLSEIEFEKKLIRNLGTSEKPTSSSGSICKSCLTLQNGKKKLLPAACRQTNTTSAYPANSFQTEVRVATHKIFFIRKRAK